VGFLWSDDETPLENKRGKKKSAQTNFTVGCDNCELKKVWSTLTSAKMAMHCESEGRSDLMVIGEAPGEEEDRAGRQFIGKSGQAIRKLIPGRDLKRIAWQNTVRCRPHDNATPTAAMVHSCRDFLNEDILKVRPRAILGLGGVPLKRFYGPRKDEPSIVDAAGLKFPIQVGDHICWYYPALHPAATVYNYAAEPVFRADVKDFFKRCDTWGKPKITTFDPKKVQQVRSEEEARTLLALMQDPVAIDFETTKLRPYMKDACLRTAAISDGKITIAFPLRWPDIDNRWGVELVKEVAKTRRWVAHSGAMELTWLWNEIGWDWFPDNFEDTMAIARILHQRSAMLALADVTRIHLGTNVKELSDIDTLNLTRYKLEDVLSYNGLDAEGTALAWREMTPKLTPTDKTNVERLVATTRSTVAMELKGLPCDLKVTNELYNIFTKKHEEAVENIYKQPEVRAFEAVNQRKFAVGSKELVEVVKLIPGSYEYFKKTKKGNISVDEEFLEDIEHLSQLPRAILDERESKKQLSTYIIPIRDGTLIHPDGLLHPGYTVTFTHTGRLSSEGPNIQNFPKHTHREVRRQVVPPKGYILVAIDYGQLEARMFAMACRDRNFINDILNNIDIHTRYLERALVLYPEYPEVILKVTGCSPEKIRKEGRQLIKNGFVFATLYGAQPKTATKYSHLPVHIAERLGDMLWCDYPDAKKWIDGQRDIYRETGSVSTLTGMIRHGIMKGNEPLNTPIQGTSTGHIVTDAQNELSTLALKEKDWNLHPRINVHDDLSFFLPDHIPTAMEYLDIITSVMVKVRYRFQVVPLMVEVSVGPNWADLEEVGKFVGDYVRS
jgi:uracil-DNA glycosylase family 4